VSNLETREWSRGGRQVDVGLLFTGAQSRRDKVESVCAYDQTYIDASVWEIFYRAKVRNRAGRRARPNGAARNNVGPAGRERETDHSTPVKRRTEW
jgi:hypothetical protein